LYVHSRLLAMFDLRKKRTWFRSTLVFTGDWAQLFNKTNGTHKLDFHQ
jgi:hypothetical protein